MFGFFRTMLALWVMIFHLADIPLIGLYAVFSFFVLSGFLMTMIMQENYGYTYVGIKKYVINRFLRLYPMYWLACMLTIIFIFITGGEYASSYHDTLYIPNNMKEWLYNVAMFFPAPSLYIGDVDPRLSPATWALTVEIFFYIAIALGISKNNKNTLLWVLLSIIFYIYSYVVGLNDSYRYGFILGASLPFSIGALLYFYKDLVNDNLIKFNISSPIIILPIYISTTLFFLFNDYYRPFDISLYLAILGKYLNILLTSIVIISLLYKGKDIFNEKIDKFIGDYSYPIYLIHWQCGLLSSYVIFNEPIKGHSINGLIVFMTSLFLVICISSIFIFFIDKKISNIRNKVKKL